VGGAKVAFWFGEIFSPLGEIFSPLGEIFSPLGEIFSPLGEIFSPLGEIFSPRSTISFAVSVCVGIWPIRIFATALYPYDEQPLLIASVRSIYPFSHNDLRVVIIVLLVIPSAEAR
jgi:hypothetical protein